MKIINIQQDTKKWLDWRSSGLGSTDIGAIMNMNAYKTALDVFEEKLGISFKTVETNELMQLGKDAEPFIRDEFNQKFARNYIPICVQDDTHEFLIGSLDGYCEETNTVLEIKYSKYAKMSDCIKKNNVDLLKETYPQYYCQIQYFLYLTKAEKAFLATYDLNSQLLYMTLDRDETFIEEMISAAVDFWNNHILKRIAPTEIKSGYVLVDDEEAIELATELEKIELRRKERAKEEREDKKISDNLRAKLVEYSDDGDFKCGNLYLKRVARNKLDTEKLYSDYKIDEEILKRYTSQEIGYWKLTIA